MDPKKHHHSPGKIFTAFWLFLGWFAQIIPLAAFPAPADWKLETLETDCSDWWQSLRVQTVPGVVYHLQKSHTLAAEDWTTLSTTYGTGGEWICPVFPGSAPSVPLPAGTPHLPSATATIHRMAYLILEKTTAGGTLISWTSLDDQTPRRMLLPGIVLDPVWEEFESGYFNQHGNYLFALSPHLYTPVTFTAAAPTLGTLDTAMVAAFTAALPTITANIQNSVAMAAQFSPQPENQGDKAFYRFSADWSVDSDGDGRLDWEELVLDGNNPFVTDTDGDGTPDQGITDTQAGAGGGGLPTPTDAQPATPLAHVEQQTIGAYRTSLDYDDPEEENFIYASAHDSEGMEYSAAQIEPLENATSYPAFTAAVNNLPFITDHWTSLNSKYGIHREARDPTLGQTWSDYDYTRCRYRLKLDAPAPAGGYKIPLRIAQIYNTFNFQTQKYVPSPSPAGVPLYVEIMLECAEGQTDGIPNEIPDPLNVDDNQKVTYVPGSITTETGSAYPFVVPENGTCVTSTGNFIVNFGNGFAGGGQDSMKIHWYKRKLNGTGSFEEWVQMYDPFHMPATELIPLEGWREPLRGEQPGIYQLEARLDLSDGRTIKFPFVRMRNARSIKNGDGDENPLLKAGQPDYFGVCDNDISKNVRDAAVIWLGDTGYSGTQDINTKAGDPNNPSTKGSPKCNLFVTHISNSVGASTPFYTRFGRVRGTIIPSFSVPAAPAAREDWYTNPELDVDLDGPGWKFQGISPSPYPGMIVASPHTSAGTLHGHVGILDYDGSWINAGGKTVNKFVHLADTKPDYKPNNMRSR